MVSEEQLVSQKTGGADENKLQDPMASAVATIIQIDRSCRMRIVLPNLNALFDYLSGP